jgi:AAA domain
MIPPEAEQFAKASSYKDWAKENPNGRDASGNKTTPIITAKAWKWRDPRTIPPRQWLYGGHYIRQFASATIAPGGVGKSGLILVELIGMTISKNLTKGAIQNKPLVVWYWNLEDPSDEIDRRIAAILMHYCIDHRDIEGRLFVNSEEPLVIAEKQRDQTIIWHPLVEALKAEIKARGVDVLAIDPFVSCHRVPENDNPAIDVVAKTWAGVARETFSAVELVHHVRKPSNGSSEFSIDDARGASSLIGATRSNRVLNRMTKEEAGIPAEERRFYFRLDKGEKDNMRPPLENAEWRKLVSVHLGNQTPDNPEDVVGVVTKWEIPGALDGLTTADLLRVQKKIAEGEWREDIRSTNWAGKAVAEVLGLDLSEPKARANIKTMLQTWIKTGALKIAIRLASNRHERKFVEVGQWAV